MSTRTEHGEKMFDIIFRKLQYVSKGGWLRLAFLGFMVFLCAGIAVLMFYGPGWFA